MRDLSRCKPTPSPAFDGCYFRCQRFAAQIQATERLRWTSERIENVPIFAPHVANQGNSSLGIALQRPRHGRQRSSLLRVPTNQRGDVDRLTIYVVELWINGLKRQATKYSE